MIRRWSMAPDSARPRAINGDKAHALYVEPDYRNRGLARQLVQLCTAEAARRKILVVTLHASEAGRPLYETLGFRTTNEMLYAQPTGDSSTP